MTLKPSPIAFIVFLLAGWINRQQLIVIEYLKENRMLRERLKGRSLRFSDRERALLARKAFDIPRKALHELGTLVTPDTLLRWHRQLIAQKFTCARHNPERPRTMRIIAKLIVPMPLENPAEAIPESKAPLVIFQTKKPILQQSYVSNWRAHATWNSTKGNSKLATRIAERRLLNRQ